MQEQLSDHKKPLVIVRGGGDIATGTIMMLHACGFSVLVLEAAQPSAIRRNVAFSEAVYQEMQTVEGVTAYLAKDIQEAENLLEQGKIAVLVDPACSCLKDFRPLALVDAILAKKNLGTDRSMAPVTIALGPGFTAGKDVDAVVETCRGHHLGRVIYEGTAIPDTGIPGKIRGFDKERVIHSPVEGIFRGVRKIADQVEKGETIAVIETKEGRVPVEATLTGLLRGLIRDGYPVTKGFKIADIDPRVNECGNCFLVSDKSRCIAGGVLEVILTLSRKGEDAAGYPVLPDWKQE